jgi:hypothetical protein
MWNLRLVHLETMLVSVQDRGTVCAECTICLEIILDILYAHKLFWTHPMVLLGDVAQVEA